MIRPMETTDIPRVFEIDKASAALYWPERSYHFEVEKNENSRPFVAADEEGHILGFIVFWLIIDEAHLANFAVSADCRCRGIGRSLLRQEKYKEAMDYFERAHAREEYGRAFKQSRKFWVEKNIWWIITLLVLIIIVPLILGRIKRTKWEVIMHEHSKIRK